MLVLVPISFVHGILNTIHQLRSHLPQFWMILYGLQVMIRCFWIGFKIFIQVLSNSWDQGTTMENVINVRNCKTK